jgi:hypothetical protein
MAAEKIQEVSMGASAALVSLTLIAAGAVALTFGGCEHGPARAEGHHVAGKTIPLGAGTVRSWAAVDGEGRPNALGLTLTEGALAALGPDSTLTLRLALPEVVRPFDHLELVWGPQGHAPTGVYDVPHLDVHFYLVPPTERERLNDPALAAQVPALEQVPAGYIPVPGLLPGAGARWVDVTAPEFAGARFTHSLLYGFYGGRLVFLEPRIARSFLESRPDAVRELKLPQRYAQAGYYPTRYRVRYDAAGKEYTIALEGLVRRP